MGSMMPVRHGAPVTRGAVSETAGDRHPAASVPDLRAPGIEPPGEEAGQQGHYHHGHEGHDDGRGHHHPRHQGQVFYTGPDEVLGGRRQAEDSEPDDDSHLVAWRRHVEGAGRQTEPALEAGNHLALRWLAHLLRQSAPAGTLCRGLPVLQLTLAVELEDDLIAAIPGRRMAASVMPDT